MQRGARTPEEILTPDTYRACNVIGKSLATALTNEDAARRIADVDH